MLKNYYEIMGLSRPPTNREIHQAYRRIMLKYDKNYIDSLPSHQKQKALVRLKEVEDAYKVLSDARKRFQYDNPSSMTPVWKEKVSIVKRIRGGSVSLGRGWIVTFADMAALLLTFFVLLWSFSTTDEKKFQQIMGSLKDGFSATRLFVPKEAPKQVGMGPALDIMEVGGGKSDIFKGLRDYVEAKGLGDIVTLVKDERGTVLRINDPVLFESGEASLNPQAYQLLSTIAKIIIKSPVQVSVEGYTDDVPIKTKMFPSNWELSVARATKVVKFFIEQCNVAPHKLSATGFGDQRPVVPNDTPENRAKNRRVEIVFRRLF